MIYEFTKKNIEKAAEIIKTGGLVAFPTETVYGLGADGFNPLAVAKIFEVKNRPDFNPLILHVSDSETIEKITTCRSQKVFDLIEKFMPGPVTLVLPKREIVPDIVTSGKPSVGVRMPSNEVASEFIKTCGTPIAAPSANMFGMLSPTKAEHVEKQLGDKIEMILDGGECNVGVESTIIEFADGKFFVLRYGGLPAEEIETFLGEKLTLKRNELSPNSPGQLKSHYAPHVPIYFIDEVDIEKTKSDRAGLLVFKENRFGDKFRSVKVLSPSGDLREASANLFKFLHEFENENVEFILAEKVPEHGLGLAIIDRLSKAVNRYKIKS
jgi:L-threonylcarbamoyladenylate synthase